MGGTESRTVKAENPQETEEEDELRICDNCGCIQEFDPDTTLQCVRCGIRAPTHDTESGEDEEEYHSDEPIN